MLDQKQVNHYAQASSIDSLVAERDVVVTYVLRVLAEQGLLPSLAFKGGTCMKKIYFGKTGVSLWIWISPVVALNEANSNRF